MQRKTKALLSILVCSLLVMTNTVTYIFAATPSSITYLSPGSMTETASYVIWNDGSNYFSKDGETGYVTSSTNATEIILSAWDSMTTGGTIYLKGIIEYDVGLIFNLEKNQKGLRLVGDGAEATWLKYTGTGYAITFSTEDVSIGDYDLYIADFNLDGVEVTTGRHGILIENMGRQMSVERLKVERFDTGVDVGDDANNVITFTSVRVNICNTGIDLVGSVNEITFVDTQTIWTYACGLNISARNVKFIGCTIAPHTGVGVYMYGASNIAFYGSYFHAQTQEITALIDITGLSASFPSQSIVFSNCYWTGNNKADYGVSIKYGEHITFDTPRARLHVEAFIYLYNNAHSLTVINPDIEDTYFFDSEILTSTGSRTIGCIIESKPLISYSGLIVACNSKVVYGDAVIFSGVGIVDVSTAIAYNQSAVVVYGNTGAGKAVVIATSGIVQVNASSAVTFGDTLVAGADACVSVNNSMNISKTILGYAIQTIGEAGLVYVNIK